MYYYVNENLYATTFEKITLKYDEGLIIAIISKVKCLQLVRKGFHNIDYKPLSRLVFKSSSNCSVKRLVLVNRSQTILLLAVWCVL